MQEPARLVLAIALAAVVAYLLGSISFSIIFTELFDKKDIREMGSGNAGMTNVLRSAGMKPGVLTTICDFGKGIVACLLGAVIFSAVLGGSDGLAIWGWGTEPYRYGTYVAGIGCILGHMFPIFFGFRGGKGVLTTAAVLLMIYPPILAVDFSLFLILALATKYVSLGSIMAAATFPLWGWLFNYFVFYKAGAVSLQYMVISTLLLAVMGACVVAKHHANIGRLIHHTEKKFTLHHD